MDEPNPFSQQAVAERIARIGLVRVSLWFLGLGLLACIPGGIVVAWRGDQPGPLEIALRLLLGFVSFSTAMIVFVILIARNGNRQSE